MARTVGSAVVAKADADTQALRHGLDQLTAKPYRQEMIRGQLFEAVEIQPRSKDKQANHVLVEDLGRGDVQRTRKHLENVRHATQSGLRDLLMELNNGSSLTDFEKKIVADWDPKQKAEVFVTPIKRFEDGVLQVQAYKIVEGGSGDRQTNYYDRHGNALRGTSHRGGDAVPVGGPLDMLGPARLARQFLSGAAKAGAKAAGSTAKLPTGTANLPSGTASGGASNPPVSGKPSVPARGHPLGDTQTLPGSVRQPMRGHPLGDTKTVPGNVRQPKQYPPGAPPTPPLTGDRARPLDTTAPESAKSGKSTSQPGGTVSTSGAGNKGQPTTPERTRAEFNRVHGQYGPVPKGGVQKVDVDQALDRMEKELKKSRGETTVKEHTNSETHANVYRNVGQRGTPPPAYGWGGKVVINLQELTPAQLARYHSFNRLR